MISLKHTSGLALVLGVLAATPASAQTLTGELEALFWNLERSDDVPITVDTATTTVGIDSKDLDPGFEPGARATLGWSPAPDEQWQVSGFWVNSHSESATYTDPDSTGAVPAETVQAVTFRAFGAGQGFAGDWRQTATLESDLWGIEANYVRTLASIAGITPSVLVGLRYVNFGEDMSLLVLDQNPDRNVGQFISTMDTETSNNLYGAQIGVFAERPLAPWLSVETKVKAGLFANDADQSSFFNDGEVPRTVSLSRSETGLAGLVQAGLGLSFVVVPNVMLGLGYELTYLSGLALGPDNFARSLVSAQFTEPLGFDNDGSVFYHGGTANVRIQF